MSASPSRHRVALAVALAGVALSALTVFVHERITADPGYTSFCNLGGAINCDVVLGSRYGRMLGVPVAGLALATFALGAVLAVPGALGACAGLADLALLGLASASVGFAFVLGVIMAAVLHHACLLCLGTDLVIAAWFVTVMPLAGRFDAAPRAAWWSRRGAARTVAVVAMALAAECAGDQGRFWEYHDVLFENHEHLERESLFRYARDLALDLPAFRACLDDPATRARVGQDVDVGNRAGVNSTPTLFINGRAVAGKLDRTYYDYALIIEKEGREAHAAKGGS